MVDWDTLTLQPNETLVLRPKGPMGPDEVDALNEQIPAHLKGRLVIVDPRQFDLLLVRTID